MPGTQEHPGSFAKTGERRQHPRKITALAYVRLGDSNGGIILNVSEGGLAVTAAEIFEGSELPRLRFQLGVNADWIDASGQVVWLSDSKKGAGIQFINLTDEDRNHITRWISSRQSFTSTRDSEASLAAGEKEFRTSPPASSRNSVSEPSRVDARVEARLEKMFPSENAPRLEAEKPAEIPAPSPAQRLAQLAAQPLAQSAAQPPARPAVDAPAQFSERLPAQLPGQLPAQRLAQPVVDREVHQEVPQAMRPAVRPEVQQEVHPVARQVVHDGVQKKVQDEAKSPSQPPAQIPVQTFVPPPARTPVEISLQDPVVAQSNEPVLEKLPDFGYQTRNDWVEPETSEHLSTLQLIFFAILLTVTAFVVGLAVGRGSVDQWLSRIDRSTAEEKEQSPSANAPPVDAAPKLSSPSNAGASDPAANSSTQQNPAPTNPNSQVAGDGTPQRDGANQSPSGEARPPAETRPIVPNVTREANNESPLSDQSRGGVPNGDRAQANEQALDPSRELRLVTAPGEGNPPFVLTMPAKAVSASSSLAISYQSLIRVPAEPGPGSSHQPERLMVGGLVSHVEPQDSRAQGQSQAEEIVRLRATVNEDGTVTDVKPISGSAPLAAAAMKAVREWRYASTFLDGRPIATQADVIIVFRAR
jgi:PilZ domain/Gram-negative bacterial TonB protein C-terminal